MTLTIVSGRRLEPLHALLDARGHAPGLACPYGQGRARRTHASSGKHALRNALIPIVTLLGLTIPSLLVGAAVTEAVFLWPGLGGLGVTSIIETRLPARASPSSWSAA